MMRTTKRVSTAVDIQTLTAHDEAALADIRGRLCALRDRLRNRYVDAAGNPVPAHTRGAGRAFGSRRLQALEEACGLLERIEGLRGAPWSMQ